MDQKTLERYIDRVIKLQDERVHRLQTEELEAIALDLGLSLDDLSAEIDAHLRRGRGYIQQRLWDDAVKELREAEALAPGRVDVVMTLAESHAGRWESTGFVDDKERARDLAKSALDLEPDHEDAFQLLGRLERGDVDNHASSLGVNTGRLIVLSIATIVFALVSIGGIVGYMVLGTRVEAPPVEIDEAKTVPVTVEKHAVVNETGALEAIGGEPGSRDLKLQIAGPEADKVSFDVRKSRLDVYEDSSFYSLKAVMRNTSAQELSKVETVIELLDDEGQVLHRDDPSLLWGHQPAIRPGDLSPVNLTQRASPAVNGVRLTVKLIDGTKAAPTYPASEPVEERMGAKFPSHLSLDVRARRVDFRPSDSGKGYFEAVFELENTGEAAIKELKLQLDLFGPEDQLLDTKTGIVAYSMTPSINPGETWLENFIAQVEGNYDRYELTIIELE